MRSASLLVGVLAVGCASHDGGTGPGAGSNVDAGAPDAEPPPVPQACAQTIALYGMTGSAEGMTVPVSVDTTGTALCLELDARDNIVVAHFAAGTAYESGTQSSFKLDLFDDADQLVQAGWDVQFGSGTDARAFANLEYGVMKGQLVTMKLMVRARAGTASTDLGLSLFEPYE